MTQITRKETKIKLDMKLSMDQIDLHTLDKNMLTQFLEEQMKVREMPIESRIKRIKKV